MNKQQRFFFLFLSFLEGGAVMACELIGAKLLAPFFGTSLYVWAAALALTLGGLTTGYFLGGRLSRRYAGSKNLLYYVLIAAGLLLILMPFSSGFIMESTIELPLTEGAILSLLIFMFPPLVFMGMVSPIIINLLTLDARSAGNSAGTVYAISTLGGILFTFLMGFYIIPEFGLERPAIWTGSMLLVLPLISLFSTRKKWAFGGLIAWPLFIWISSLTGSTYTDEYQVIYQSEGILGQVKVVDHPAYGFTTDARMGRGLIVNNTLQTYVSVDHNFQYSAWTHDHYLPTAASIYPPGSKVLLLGLGGGTLVKQLHRLGYEVEAVEIDRRIWEISLEYFNMPEKVKVSIDDARHFIKTTDNTYDIIIFDTFLSESVPEHLLTLEGINDAKKILADDGMIMANFYGFINGEAGKAARSVYKTMLYAGLDVELLATPDQEASRNLIFLASRQEKDFSHTRFSVPVFPEINNLPSYFLAPGEIDTSNAILLTDQQPRLTRMYAPAARSWRKGYNAYYRKYFIK